MRTEQLGFQLCNGLRFAATAAAFSPAIREGLLRYFGDSFQDARVRDAQRYTPDLSCGGCGSRDDLITLIPDVAQVLDSRRALAKAGMKLH